MFQKKSTYSKNCQYEAIFDKVLWFIENYLPQKKKRSSYKEISLDKFESFTINKIKMLATERSKLLKGELSNKTVTFTVGTWALPYLNFLKRMKFLK